MILTPICLALMVPDDFGEYTVSYWIIILTFIFITAAVRRNWIVTIPAGIVFSIIFPVTAQVFSELLFDKGEGVLKDVSMDLVGFICLFAQALLSVWLLKYIGSLFPESAG
jgi:hypothetical protein